MSVAYIFHTCANILVLYILEVEFLCQWIHALKFLLDFAKFFLVYSFRKLECQFYKVLLQKYDH